MPQASGKYYKYSRIDKYNQVLSSEIPGDFQSDRTTLRCSELMKREKNMECGRGCDSPAEEVDVWVQTNGWVKKASAMNTLLIL